MPEQPAPRRYGRGLFLLTVAGGLSSLAWGKTVWGHVSRAVGPAESLVPLVPKGGWRIYTISGSMPQFDPATWRLQVDGLVQKPVSLSYGQLRSLPRAEQVTTFHCVTGWTVPNVHWAGVRLNDIYDLVLPLPEAEEQTMLEAPAADAGEGLPQAAPATSEGPTEQLGLF